MQHKSALDGLWWANHPELATGATDATSARVASCRASGEGFFFRFSVSVIIVAYLMYFRFVLGWFSSLIGLQLVRAVTRLAHLDDTGSERFCHLVSVELCDPVNYDCTKDAVAS